LTVVVSVAAETPSAPTEDLSELKLQWPLLGAPATKVLVTCTLSTLVGLSVSFTVFASAVLVARLKVKTPIALVLPLPGSSVLLDPLAVAATPREGIGFPKLSLMVAV
jgi:hypothetical protein